MYNKEYLNYILDILAPFGDMRAKAMFGGYGLYKEGLIVGLIAEGELYFKADTQSSNDYTAYGMGPFTYEREGKTYAMSYFKVPEEVLEDEDLLRTFLLKSYQVSLGAKQKKPKKI